MTFWTSDTSRPLTAQPQPAIDHDILMNRYRSSNFCLLCVFGSMPTCNYQGPEQDDVPGLWEEVPQRTGRERTSLGSSDEEPSCTFESL